MSAQRLSTIRVEKPWGRQLLWPGFADAESAPVGEIWFEPPAGTDDELLVKYLFTSERLSIQVHPDDAAARAAGHARGKDEAWVVLAAVPGATIGIGLTHAVTADVLRAAALDGSIETLLDWRPALAGDVIYSPAGTIHAIGAGLTLIEVQQSLDLTYRLYDYGRPRPLQIDAALAVARLAPFVPVTTARELGDGRTAVVEGGIFVLERWSWHGQRRIILPVGLSGWLISVRGGGTLDDVAFVAGECWLVEGSVVLDVARDSDLLLAYPGEAALPLLHT